MNVKISDFIVKYLVSKGCKSFFGVTGGAVVHLFDSIKKNKQAEVTFFNHEQSASFAVESYSRLTKKLGVGIFTTGPGSTNAITGLTAAWLDSIPCIFISGQARSNQIVNGRPIRQVGTQEVEIIPVVKPLTKYATTILNVGDVLYELEKAIYYAISGRPGPVWLDIPVDISWSYLAKDVLYQNSFQELKIKKNKSILKKHLVSLQSLLNKSKSPLIIAGNGVRLSGSENLFKKFIKDKKIPFVLTWSFYDAVPSNNDCNIGNIGISGQRGANIAVQNSDLIIAIGTHLNSSIVSTRPEQFAPFAKIVINNIDKNEIVSSSLDYELVFNADVSDFLLSLGQLNFSQNKEWKKTTKIYKYYNSIGEEFRNQKKYVNSYFFTSLISNLNDSPTNYVIDGGGTIVYTAYQCIKIKEKQRLLLSNSLCSMGSGFPEAIGAYIGDKNTKIICFVGDGSFPFNVQDLQLIKNYKIPIVIFVLNNNGYTSIKTTQADFLQSNYVGSTPDDGLNLLNIKSISKAFGMRYRLLKNHTNINSKLKNILNSSSPLICEVLIDPKQEIIPRQGFIKKNDGTFTPRRIDDMYPYLDRSVYKKLMRDDYCLSTSEANEIDLMRNYPKKSIKEKSINRKISINKNFNDSDDTGAIISYDLINHYSEKNNHHYGKDYFDGNRAEGYGGYSYNAIFWKNVAKDIIDFYKLTNKSSILEVGCAKGFLLYEIKKILPKINFIGIDLSEYAVSNSHKFIKKNIRIDNATNLPFDDNFFDLIFCINTLNELEKDDIILSLKEIIRVSKKHSYIAVNAWRNTREIDYFDRWSITAKSYFSTHQWLKLFNDVGYKGDYSFEFID